MAIIYISSTYSDLKDVRKAVYDTLHKMKHTVIAMEDYVATDDRPLDKCLADVGKCNIYIGIFAWRYGSIPPAESNPEEKSVTELEFRHAKKKGKECLLFLLDREAPWPVAQIEEGTGHDRIVALRNELRRDYLVSLIKKPEDLAAEIATAVYVALASTWDDTLPNSLNNASFDPLEPLPSFFLDIVKQIGKAISTSHSAKSIIVDLGTGMNWWSTRLYALAALATDFTQIRQFVFVQQERFIGMAPPFAIRRALARKHPEVELAYRNSTLPPEVVAPSREEEVTNVVKEFVVKMPRGTEVGIKEWVTQEELGHWLGVDLSRETVKLQSPELPTKSWLISQIIESGSPIVALTYNQKLVKVVDRLELAVSIARDALKMVD
jgi:hypothetical protein